MNISKVIQSETASLRQRLKTLSTLDVRKLERQRARFAKRVQQIDMQLEAIARRFGLVKSTVAKVQLPRARSVRRPRRKDLSQAIMSTLGQEKRGLTAIALSGKAGVGYQSLVGWLRRNADKLRTEGVRKYKRYFLK